MIQHTLLLLFASALCAALCGCEVNPIGTSAKLKALQKKVATHHARQRHHTAHRSAAAEGLTYVSPTWLNEYHTLEADHGGYVIPDDQKIQVSSDGKIKVPHSVVKHFNDLSRAPVRPSEPKPEE